MRIAIVKRNLILQKIDKNKIILAITSGLLLTGSFPQTNLSWLAWFALVPLLIAIKDLEFKDGFKTGLLTGLVHNISLLYWLSYTMETYGHLPIYLAVPILFLFSFYLSLYTAFFCGALTRISSKPLLLFIAIPALWVSLEYIRSFLFTGFPWELMAYSQYNSLRVIQISDILGSYGVSFLLVLSNSAVFIGFLYLTKSNWRGKKVSAFNFLSSAFIFLFALTFIWFYGKIRMETVDKAVADSNKIKVSVVQGNIEQSEKWDPALQYSATKKYLDLSGSAAFEKPDLIVWPETAAPFYFLYDAGLTEMVERGIVETGTNFLIGSPSFMRADGNIEYYNSAYLIGPDGKVSGKYDKVHLVPFGEYVPFKKWLPFLGKIVEHVGDFCPGKQGKIINLNGQSLGVLICYELIFPYLSRAEVKNGADFLVNITNDAWYGKTSAPYQHFSMAAFRAVENRRALVRAANTGISGFIDPSGRIAASTSIFENAVMTRDIQVLKEITFYTRFGDLFAYICLAAAALTLLIKTK
ncbi:MAG: apolipoprotein N-acyltransferase [Desulfobacteraceae bacterium]|nr:MAG: apolipoprotein N-acyltransferase [Desulfobacteraceae bacterium]